MGTRSPDPSSLAAMASISPITPPPSSAHPYDRSEETALESFLFFFFFFHLLTFPYIHQLQSSNMEVAPATMHLHHHKQQLQPAPKLMRQPSLKKVEYFVEVPAMDDQEVEPAVPKGFGSLAMRRVRRRMARGLGATFNFLSQLDDQECVDESGFTYQHDERVESMVRPAEERQWMLEVAADGAASWTFSFVCDDTEEQEQEQEQFHSTAEPIDRRLLLSRKASDF